MEHIVYKDPEKIKQDIRVYYKTHLKGGGESFGQQYVNVIRNVFGKVKTIYECCAGCGFIGFRLLAENLCEEVVFSDVNKEAIECLKKTARDNVLDVPAPVKPQVRIYQGDNLKCIPEHEKFDLVIGNPPHFMCGGGRGIITDDNDWNFHRQFYYGIKKFLKPNASVLLQECYAGSDEKDFLGFIQAGDLIFVTSFQDRLDLKETINPYYFLWVVPKQKNMLYSSLARSISLDYPFVEFQNVEFPYGISNKLLLKPYRMYSFVIKNNTREFVSFTLHNTKRQFFNNIPFLDLQPGRIGTTKPFYFTPGEFVIKGNRSVCNIEVKE